MTDCDIRFLEIVIWNVKSSVIHRLHVGMGTGLDFAQLCNLLTLLTEPSNTAGLPFSFAFYADSGFGVPSESSVQGLKVWVWSLSVTMKQKPVCLQRVLCSNEYCV